MILKHSGLFFIGLLILVAMYNFPAIPQPHDYHHFADNITLAGLPNFFNLVSNIGFFIVGYLGLAYLNHHSVENKIGYQIFFGGVLLTCFGSSYYHWSPDHWGLFWDRLPITIAFNALFFCVLREKLKLSVYWLGIFLAMGMSSLLYWYWSELQGSGDMRAYILVQLLPMLLIPYIIFVYKNHYTRQYDWLISLCFYALAKIFELFDGAIFQLTGVIGGHPLKHLMAALACYWLYRMLRLRSPVKLVS